MDLNLTDISPIASIAEWLFVALVWSGPIGLAVFRRRFARAPGEMRGVKAALVGLTALTAPFAALMILMVLVGTYEAGVLVLSLVKAAW
jgi:hypothetical protein